LTAHEASGLLRNREISSVELTEAVLERIGQVEPNLGAHISVTSDLAMKQANAADLAIQEGVVHSLCGIPIGLKDVLSTADVETTCGSRMLEGFVPPFDATVVGKLRGIGAVFTGKLNLDEFAMGSSTENSAFHVTKNPWDLTRVPGGSSGGSAAAVASYECMVSLGSDTGGSIRQPASFCGVVGVKPTYGRVSRFGLVAFASSLDQIGPIARDVEDAAILLEAISGGDSNDSTSLHVEVPNYCEVLGRSIEGLRVGVPVEYFGSGLDDDVKELVLKAIDQLADLGAEVVDVSLPHTEYALATYYLLAPAEASANLARYNGVKYGYSNLESVDVSDMMASSRARGFGEEVKRRIMLGTYALSAGYYDSYYLKAQKVRTLIRSDFDEVFQNVDLLAAPVSPSVAFSLGDRIDDPYEMYMSDAMTIPASMAGIAGLSVPCGFAEGLPVGLQMLGPALSEPTLLQAAYAYEQEAKILFKAPSLDV